MDATSAGGREPHGPRQRQPPGFASEEFVRFLDERDLSVLDVVRGATPETRRLMLGDGATGEITHVVAVAHPWADTAAVDNERAVLTSSTRQAATVLDATAPRVIDQVQVTPGRAGLIMAAVPGLQVRTDGGAPLDPDALTATGRWLADVWHQTGSTRGPVELGRQGTASLVARYGGHRRPAPVVAALERARRRLARQEVRMTLTHGCLCPRHVFWADGVIVGVDDWGRAAVAGDPSRDLATFAVRSAGAALPQVIAGRSRRATRVRDFVRTGLDTLGLPSTLWREVLVAAQLELTIGTLQDDDQEGSVALLGDAVRMLPTRL